MNAMGKYYVISQTLNKKIATEVDNSASEEYVYEIIVKHNVGHTDGRYEVRLYHNGKWVDWELNGWKFSKIIYGYYKYIDTYTLQESTSYTIEALSPIEEDVKLHYENYTRYYDSSDLVVLVYNMMHVVSSLCKTKGDYEKLSGLYKVKSTSPVLSSAIEELQTIGDINTILEKSNNNDVRNIVKNLLNERLIRAKAILQKIEIR